MFHMKIKADVVREVTLPCEFRLQRLSDGMFVLSGHEGVKFVSDWESASYYGSSVDEDGEYGEEATLDYQWNWVTVECGDDLSPLKKEDFRVHIVLGGEDNC